VLLNAEQLETYEREGYLEIPELFSEEETAVLRADLARILSLDRPEVPRAASDRLPQSISGNIWS
jgi:ectoine hydroxylase